MSATTAAATQGVETAEDLAPEARNALRSLILTLADTKRLLGIRYSDWMLGAPTLEAGIAASSMAQDEWGHGRLTYALLSDFGDNPKEIEHEREAHEYHSMDALDHPLRSWSELIATSLTLDTALTVQYRVLLDSGYTPVHNRVQKLLDEEKYHFHYAAAWARRLAGAAAVREEFREAVDRLLPAALHWFGRAEAPEARLLVREGLVRGGPDPLRARFLARVAPVLGDLAASLGLTEGDDGWAYTRTLDWSDWNDATHRRGGEGPDPDTLVRIRGDKNRAMLLD